MIQEQDTNIELSSNIDSDKQLLLQETLSTKRKICMGVAFSVGKFHYVMFQNANLFFPGKRKPCSMLSVGFA